MTILVLAALLVVGGAVGGLVVYLHQSAATKAKIDAAVANAVAQVKKV